MCGGLTMCELSVDDEEQHSEQDDAGQRLARQLEQLGRKLGSERDDE